mmetsp:Transcript_35858/g.34915  ORF Transcript_35858/g.34915 Transcript_35858/m.34915 type:complete len:192 (-) Transcript_35858:29-604(-)
MKAYLKSKPNVIVQQWTAQKPLLASEKVKIFFSHGGYNSILESIEGKTPIAVAPSMPSDQMYNCDLVQKNKYGVCLGVPSLEKLEQTVKLLEENNFYQENLAHASKIIKQKREDPHDTLYWIDYVLEVGASHLNSKDTIRLNYFSLCDMDIHFTLFGILLAILLVMLFSLKLCCKCLCGKKKEPVLKGKMD